jgi:hypothetical protein
MEKKTAQNAMLKAAQILSITAALLELALSQFHIRLTRLSSAETTGISLFGFIIFGLITLFAVTRMGERARGKLFAVFTNAAAAAFATGCLYLLFTDKIFMGNLYRSQNPKTGVPELLPLAGRISASVPLALIIAGTACYYLSALMILIAVCMRKTGAETA